MLVRIKGKMINDKIQFNFPALFFENKAFVCLQSLVINFKIIQKIVTGHISTTLIDRNPVNPEQVLADFQSITASKHFCYQPTHLNYYKIQRMDLASSEFGFTFRENIKISDIDEVEILLHILDARIQQGFKQPIL